jgi:poly-gamma-glutamate biosynthesis protein PgsC/CapC
VHDYLFSIEAVRFAFVAGIVTSMLLYERRHVTTGSIVVPGYIGIFLVQPLTIVATFANALFSYWLVNKVVQRRFLLYGRTKFSVLVIVSTAIQALMLEFSPHGSYLWESSVPLLVGAGYVIPALIAHDMARQGVRKTTVTVLAAGAIVGVPVVAALLLGLPGVDAKAALVGFGVISIQPGWVPFAVLLSVAAAWGLLNNHNLRSGGFVGAAYLGMLFAQPLQVAFILVVGLVTYLTVSRLLMPWMILFGRRKFATMLIVAGMTSWTLMWVGQTLFGFQITYYMTLSSIALTPVFVPGLVANDMERTGPVRVLLGVVLGAGFVIPATWVVQDVVEHGVLSANWFVVALAAGSVIFHPQVRALGAWICARVGIELPAGRTRARHVAAPATSEFAEPRVPAVRPPVPRLQPAEAGEDIRTVEHAAVG